MFIREETINSHYTRKSKLGKEHKYQRNKKIIHFVCDNCGNKFTREKGSMDPKRLNNNYFHVCENCDAKRFAQKKGVEQKYKWDMPASSNLPINKF